MTIYKKLDVWSQAIELVKEFRAVSNCLIQEREFELHKQIVRSAISIPSNIAEGASSGSDPNFIRYLNISLGSISEFQTQLEICILWEVVFPEVATQLIKQSENLAYRIRKLKKYLENQP